MDVIHDHTEGWVVELQMVAVSLQGGDRKFLKALEGAKTSSMEYLAEEVLDKQEAEIPRIFCSALAFWKISMLTSAMQ